MDYKLVLEIANKPQENDILIFKDGKWKCIERGIDKTVLFDNIFENSKKIKKLTDIVEIQENRINELVKEIKYLKGEE